jgi:hypothetical protein
MFMNQLSLSHDPVPVNTQEAVATRLWVKTKTWSLLLITTAIPPLGNP